MIDQVEDFLIALAAFVGFWCLFAASWLLSLRYGQHTFEPCSVKDKAEWCARINSTVHASIVIPGVLACLIKNSWSSDSIPFTSPQECRTIFSISIGYFCADLIVLLLWKLEHWKMFVVHHITAVTPYAINNFVPGCHCGNYVLALYLLVEIPTLPLNYMGLMDQLGLRGHKSRYIAFLTMYGLWFLARIILPVYILVVLYEIIVPAWYSERTGAEFAVCVMPGVVSANVIAFFCFYVFLTHLSVDLYKECVEAGICPAYIRGYTKTLDDEPDSNSGADVRSSIASMQRGSVSSSIVNVEEAQSLLTRSGRYGSMSHIRTSHDTAQQQQQQHMRDDVMSRSISSRTSLSARSSAGGGDDSSSDDEVYGIKQIFKRRVSPTTRSASSQQQQKTQSLVVSSAHV